MASTPQDRIDVQCPRCPRVLATRQGLRRHLRTVHDVIDATRACTVCGRDRDAEAHFGRVGMDTQGRPRYRSICNDCKDEQQRARWRRQAARPESHRRRDRKKGVAQRFGLTLNEYEAALARYMDEQDGRCAVCRKGGRLELDHCHATGRLRGLLCHGCNVAAGFLIDNPANADALAAYLRKAGQ